MKKEKTIGHLEIIDDELRRLLSRGMKLRNKILDKTLEEAVEILEEELVSKMTKAYEETADYIDGKPIIEAVKHLIFKNLPSIMEMENAQNLKDKKILRIFLTIFILLFVLTGIFLVYAYVNYIR